MSTQSVTLVAAAARAASGDSGAIAGFGTNDTARVQLNVTAFAGTSPTLDVVIEDTVDGTNWNTVGTFTQRTGTGRQVITVADIVTNQLRVRWTISGAGASFTFDVAAQVE